MGFEKHIESKINSFSRDGKTDSRDGKTEQITGQPLSRKPTNLDDIRNQTYGKSANAREIPAATASGGTSEPNKMEYSKPQAAPEASASVRASRTQEAAPAQSQAARSTASEKTSAPEHQVAQASKFNSGASRDAAGSEMSYKTEQSSRSFEAKSSVHADSATMPATSMKQEQCPLKAFDAHFPAEKWSHPSEPAAQSEAPAARSHTPAGSPSEAPAARPHASAPSSGERANVSAAQMNGPADRAQQVSPNKNNNSFADRMPSQSVAERSHASNEQPEAPTARSASREITAKPAPAIAVASDAGEKTAAPKSNVIPFAQSHDNMQVVTTGVPRVLEHKQDLSQQVHFDAAAQRAESGKVVPFSTDKDKVSISVTRREDQADIAPSLKPTAHRVADQFDMNPPAKRTEATDPRGPRHADSTDGAAIAALLDGRRTGPTGGSSMVPGPISVDSRINAIIKGSDAKNQGGSNLVANAERGADSKSVAQPSRRPTETSADAKSIKSNADSKQATGGTDIRTATVKPAATPERILGGSTHISASDAKQSIHASRRPELSITPSAADAKAIAPHDSNRSAIKISEARIAPAAAAASAAKSHIEVAFNAIIENIKTRGNRADATIQAPSRRAPQIADRPATAKDAAQATTRRGAEIGDRPATGKDGADKGDKLVCIIFNPVSNVVRVIQDVVNNLLSLFASPKSLTMLAGVAVRDNAGQDDRKPVTFSVAADKALSPRNELVKVGRMMAREEKQFAAGTLAASKSIAKDVCLAAGKKATLETLSDDDNEEEGDDEPTVKVIGRGEGVQEANEKRIAGESDDDESDTVVVVRGSKIEKEETEENDNEDETANNRAAGTAVGGGVSKSQSHQNAAPNLMAREIYITKENDRLDLIAIAKYRRAAVAELIFNINKTALQSPTRPIRAGISLQLPSSVEVELFFNRTRTASAATTLAYALRNAS